MRLWLVAIAACLLVAVYRFGFEQHTAVSAAPAIAASPAQVAKPTGPRIRYAAHKAPELTLPDGRRETVHSVLNITRQMRFGDFVWNEDGIAQGRVWVRVDLARQLLSVFRDGHEIGSSVILYGADSKETPLGHFTILAKSKDYHSRSYDTPMPYMLRLTDDGVAIHGSNVRQGWATHGCIGVPLDFAKLLFAATKKGDTVVILPAGGMAEKT